MWDWSEDTDNENHYYNNSPYSNPQSNHAASPPISQHTNENLPDEHGIIPFNSTKFVSKLINASITKPISNIPYHHSMISFINNKYPNLCRPYMIFQSYGTNVGNHDFDDAWIERSDEYVDNLTVADKYILRIYTRNGDEVVNNTLREDRVNQKTNELLTKMKEEDRCMFAVSLFREQNDLRDEYFTVHGERLSSLGQDRLDTLYSQRIVSEEDTFTYIQKYANELRRVIRAGPKIRNQQIVFRSINNDYLEVYEHAQTTIRGFTSTTFQPYAASYYAHGKFYGNMYEMILTPGTHAVSMHNISEFPSENEILLDFGCFVHPLDKHEKLMISEVYNYTNPKDNYDRRIFPYSYYNSREVLVLTDQNHTVPVSGGKRSGSVKKLKSSIRRTRKTTRKLSSTRRKMPSDAHLPFWKVRDNSIPLLSNIPIPTNESNLLSKAANDYMAAIYPRPVSSSKKESIKSRRTKKVDTTKNKSM